MELALEAYRKSSFDDGSLIDTEPAVERFVAL